MAWMTCLTTLFQSKNISSDLLLLELSSFFNEESYFSSLLATDQIYSTIIDLVTSLLLSPASSTSSSSESEPSSSSSSSSSKAHPFFRSWKEYQYYSLFLPFSKVIQILKNPQKNNKIQSSGSPFPLPYETLPSSISERIALGECGCFSSDLEKSLLLLLETLWTSRIEFLLQFQSLYYRFHENQAMEEKKKRERLSMEKRQYETAVTICFLGLRQFPNNSLLLSCYHHYQYYYHFNLTLSSPSIPHSLISHYFSSYLPSSRYYGNYEFSLKEMIYQVYNHCYYAIKNVQQKKTEIAALCALSAVPTSSVADPSLVSSKSQQVAETVRTDPSSSHLWLMPDWKQFFSQLQCHLWNEDDYHKVYSFLIKCITISYSQRYILFWRWLLYLILYRNLSLLWTDSSSELTKSRLKNQKSSEEETQKCQVKALEEVKRLIIQAIYLHSNCKDLYLDLIGLLRPLYHETSSFTQGNSQEHQSSVMKEIESLLYLMEERGIYLRS
jgi:hypothetical protein